MNLSYFFVTIYIWGMGLLHFCVIIFVQTKALSSKSTISVLLFKQKHSVGNRNFTSISSILEFALKYTHFKYSWSTWVKKKASEKIQRRDFRLVNDSRISLIVWTPISKIVTLLIFGCGVKPTWSAQLGFEIKFRKYTLDKRGKFSGTKASLCSYI